MFTGGVKVVFSYFVNTLPGDARPMLTVYQNTYQIIFLVGNSVNPIANHEQKYILE